MLNKVKSCCLKILQNLGKSLFQKKKNSILGIMQDKAEIKGDIVSSIDEKWDANNGKL